MFLTTLLGLVSIVFTAPQVQALKITYPTNRVYQIDFNTPLMFSWTSNTSDPEFMDIVIKWKKGVKLGDFTQEATGMLVPGQHLPSKSNIFLIPWNVWPYQVGMSCQIIIGNSTTQETFDHTEVFQLVNMNPTSAYGRQSSTIAATISSSAIANSATISPSYPGYGGYSVSLPAFSEVNSNMTEWACTQTSWEFSGQSPNIQSLLKTATDCEQYSTTTTDAGTTLSSSERSSPTSSTTITATVPISTARASNSTSTAAKPPVTSAGSTPALPTETSGSLPVRRKPHGVVLGWVYAVLTAVITIISICE